MSIGSEFLSVSSLLKKILSNLGLKVENIKLPENIQISILSNSKIFSDNKKVRIQDNKINLNFQRLNKKEKQAILDYIKEIRESQEDYLFIERNSFETVQDIKKIKNDFKTIEKYKQVFLPDDFSVLESAVYIKHLQENNNRVKIPKLKQQIRNKFGERGNTICNLYSASYFNKLIFPLYEELSKSPDFTIDNFKSTFDKLIRDFPLAIFIHRLMSVSEIKQKIRDRIETNKNYGIKKAHIHGIGKTNCENIKQAIKELEEEKYEFSKSINEKNTIIIVTLDF